jgi:hypothetical protein
MSHVIEGHGQARRRIMHILDESGDTRTMWNPHNETEVDAAKEMFDRLIGEGFRAFRVREGEPGERVTEFDAEAEKLIFVPQMQGG